jgi:hypothetical protein
MLAADDAVPLSPPVTVVQSDSDGSSSSDDSEGSAESDVGPALVRVSSGLRLQNGISPFPRAFDPTSPCEFEPIPPTFDSREQYLDVMKQHVLAELSASVTGAQEVLEVTGVVVGLDGLIPTFYFSPAPESLDGSWYRRLLRAPLDKGGGFFIVHEDRPRFADQPYGAPPCDRVVQLSQMPFFPMYDEHGESTRITFRTYDFVGDLIAAFEAIEALRVVSGGCSYFLRSILTQIYACHA